MNKKERIITLYQEGKTVKEILKAVEAYESYVRSTIKTYKLEQQLKALQK